MLNNKKGVELTMNMIVVAAITLLILIILAFILMGGLDNWRKGTGCDANQGKCTLLKTVCDDGYVTSGYSCPNVNKEAYRCCVPFLGEIPAAGSK